MNKKTAILTSLAAAGFIGITAVATVSIVNELNSRQVNAPDNFALTAAGLPDTSGISAALPDLPKVSDLPLTKNVSSGSNGPNQSTLSISMPTAEQLVVAATGGQFQSSKGVVKKGIAAFAVTVQRTDKSVITGFVDKASGTIFDWEIVKSGQSSNGYDHDDDDDDREDRDHDDDDKYDDDDD